MAEWKDFEQLITKIYTAATPNATVCHDEKIVGKSGTECQIDVSIRARVGLHNVLIIVECKYHNRRIGIGRVGEFVEKMEDVRASQGVMVSSKGFTKDARQSAQRHGVTLLSYRQAEVSDWSVVGDTSSWVKIISRMPTAEVPWAVFPDGSAKPLKHDTPIFALDGSSQGVIGDITGQLLGTGETIAGLPPGWVNFDLNLDRPSCVMVDGKLRQVRIYQIRAYIRAYYYVVNAPLASGHVLERAPDGGPLYREFHSQEFSLSHIFRTQPRQPLSADEYESIIARSIPLPDVVMEEGTKMRFTIHLPTLEEE